jgi:L-galactose dehydrogenase
MKYRILGKTGLKVSILSYGASALGSVFRKIDENEGIKTVQRAIDYGINYIDCSPFYGITTAEIILGKALLDISRDKYFLSTKAGRYGWDEFDFSCQRIIHSAEESMKRLNVEYLDILYLHDIEYHEGCYLEQALTEGLKALIKLKEQGKIRFYGFTAYPLQVLKYGIENVEIDTVMSHKLYGLNDIRLIELLPLIKAKNIGLINSAPLGSGLLTTRGVAAWHPATREDRNVVEKAIHFCLQNGTTLEKIAIQFAINNNNIPTTLVSTANSDRIKMNANYVKEAFNQKLAKQVQNILRPLMNRDWEDVIEEKLNETKS